MNKTISVEELAKSMPGAIKRIAVLIHDAENEVKDNRQRLAQFSNRR